LLATLERMAILDKADELAAMITESEEAEHYRKSLYKLKNSSETQRKIQDFVKMKELYEEVQRFGKYHPEYKRVMMSIRELKRDMDMDDHVAEFRRAETGLQNLLDEISMMIGRSVSEHIKVPAGNPFFESSCGGGCGSGGSCGCSA
jgi:cell fate (sporulation/competence/biofilm development) regulator YlbF (YheA/YmcA/DUF963 family)